MNCAEARDELLVADVNDLRQTAGTPLAAHLEACADCRRLASIIVRGTAGLAVAVTSRRAPGIIRRPFRRIALVSTISLTAAAAVLAIAIESRPPHRGVVATIPTTSLPVERQVSLDVSRGQRAAVLKTADPKVTVIWLSPGEGQ
jgi:predicted secreted Zn-dependent protease